MNGPRVKSETIKSLPDQDILTESSSSIESPAAVGTCELTDRWGKTVHQRQGRIIGYATEHVLPQPLLQLPQIDSLAQEGRGLQLPEGREEVLVMAAKIPMDSPIPSGSAT